jgi:hypothetical protein
MSVHQRSVQDWCEEVWRRFSNDMPVQLLLKLDGLRERPSYSRLLNFVLYFRLWAEVSGKDVSNHIPYESEVEKWFPEK